MQLKVSLQKYCPSYFPAKVLYNLFPCKSTVQSMIKHHTVVLCFPSDQGFLTQTSAQHCAWLRIYSLKEHATATV